MLWEELAPRTGKNGKKGLCYPHRASIDQRHVSVASRVRELARPFDGCSVGAATARMHWTKELEHGQAERGDDLFEPLNGDRLVLSFDEAHRCRTDSDGLCESALRIAEVFAPSENSSTYCHDVPSFKELKTRVNRFKTMKPRDVGPCRT